MSEDEGLEFTVTGTIYKNHHHRAAKKRIKYTEFRFALQTVFSADNIKILIYLLFLIKEKKKNKQKLIKKQTNKQNKTFRELRMRMQRFYRLFNLHVK